MVKACGLSCKWNVWTSGLWYRVAIQVVTDLSGQSDVPVLRVEVCAEDEGSSFSRNTGRFIMFSVITNIYNKKTKGPILMELFTATGKLKKFFFWQLEMFDVCTTADTVHIGTIFKLLPHTRVVKEKTFSLGDSSPLCANYNISIDKVGKSKHNKTLLRYRSQNFFSFTVAVNNSIKVGPLVFLL